jgi:hypothetical protein
VSDCPCPISADGFSILETDSDLAILEQNLQVSVDAIITWAAFKKLMISAAKSHVTLFTPWNKQFNYQRKVYVHGVLIPLCKTPRLLGNHLDTMHTGNNQASTASSKGNQRYNLMKAVSGHNKETLLMIFKALIGSVFDFGHPITSLTANQQT